MSDKKQPQYRYVYRSSVTGRYVTKEFAETHRGITIREKRKIKK